MRVWLLVMAIFLHCCLSGSNPSLKILDEELEIENIAAKDVMRKPRSVESQKTHEDPLLKVLSFADDIDNEADSNGEFSSAILTKASFPEAFTICSAFMVDAWTTDFAAAYVLSMAKDDGSNLWGYMKIYAASSYTKYHVNLGPSSLSAQASTVFVPLQWTRMCLSLDFTAGKAILVVDGESHGEADHDKEGDQNRPTNLSLLLGLREAPRKDFQCSTGILP